MAAQVDDGLDYRRLPGDGSPPETAHTLPFGFRLARRMRRSIGERDWHSLHIRARGPIFLVCPHVKHRQLRSVSLRFVRRLRSYYGEVRLLMSVHHRLRLLTFPMRTADANNSGQTRGIPGSDTIHLRVMCSSTPAG